MSAAQCASKSSGVTWSRNSRNFSTSSSCSAGTARPASSSTSSAQTIRVPVRSASAIESEGRALTSAPEPKTRIAKKTPSLTSVIRTSVELVAGGLEHVLHQVVGQRPRRDDALLGEGDRGGLDRADPDRQVALPRHLAQQHDRLVRGHLDPDSHDIDFAHAFTLLRAGEHAPNGRRSASDRRPALTRVACSRTESAAISLTASSARALAAASRPRLCGATTCSTRPTSRSAAVLNARRCRGSKPKSASSRGGLGDHQRVGVVVAGAGARHDQAELLELVEQLLGDLGDLEQLLRESRTLSLARRTTPRLGRPSAASATLRHRRAPPARSAAARGRGRSRRGARRSP